MASGLITSWQMDGGKMETVTDFIFFGQNHCRWWLLDPWKKSYDKPTQHIKKQRHYFVNKDPYSQSCGFSSSHVWIWELDHKEGQVAKNWCFWTVVLEKTLESPLDSKEIKPVNPKGNQPWIFIGRTDAEAPILWPPDAKNWLVRKDFDAGKDFLHSPFCSLSGMFFLKQVKFIICGGVLYTCCLHCLEHSALDLYMPDSFLSCLSLQMSPSQRAFLDHPSVTLYHIALFYSLHIFVIS